MDLNDIFALKELLDKNVEKIHAKLQHVTRHSEILYKILDMRWVNVVKGDRALIGLHDVLLSSMSGVNECLIKCNMQIDLNNLEPFVANIGDSLQRNDFVWHAYKDRIECVKSALSPVGPVSDGLLFSMCSSRMIKPDAEIPKQKVKPMTAPQSTSAQPQDTAIASADSKALPPISTGKRILKPPKGGKTTPSSEIYHQIVKNVTAFPEGSVINAVVMHLNIAKKCFFVGMWDAEPLRELFSGKLHLKELDQLPNFGEIFAVYDDGNDGVIPRVIINDYADGGGYDAYLIDFGEHIHMNGEETIYALPDDIRLLPAEAIRCFFRECDVSHMTHFRFKKVTLCVLEKRSDDLIVELVDENANNSRRKNSLPKATAADSIQDQSVPVPCQTTNPNGPQLSEADMAMPNDIDEGTSDPLKAVLGFRPKDEQRICRHYDPKIKGCFKGSSCRLVHEPFAAYGATKNLELVDALPETARHALLLRELGTIVKMLVTCVSSTTVVYAQFVDGSSPLVWTKDDVLRAKSQFKRKPYMLDIVLAHYNDGCYYRAQIIEESENEYKIFYVDYGNTEFVPLNALVPCGDVDRMRPYRAVSCYIEGVVYKSSLSQKKAVECMEYLKSKILNVEEDVMLVSSLHNGYEIRFLGDNADLPVKLMKRGYAQPNQDGPNPYDSDLDQ
ncbi:uncharacterized protein LOC108161245 [Drosophila miranda]|uniref:uncharacterized protein LOC108161245 n=1 Tax=Drosophila miranda TaxID=7229 RepID=UPI0007E742A6|nr:uncharacterized protein LOC108161245 [Drosophila miranda]